MISSIAAKIPAEDRVRANTTSETNARIDSDLERRLAFFATQGKEAIGRRIEELDREWDIERVLETNAATLALTGVVLGAAVNRKWLLLPMVVTSFLLQHAIQGWCPPVPVFRRMGIRTRLEIERERYALKLLRGDFDNLEGPRATDLNDSIRKLMVRIGQTSPV